MLRDHDKFVVRKAFEIILVLEGERDFEVYTADYQLLTG